MTQAGTAALSALSEALTVGTRVVDTVDRPGTVTDVEPATNDVQVQWDHRDATEWVGAARIRKTAAITATTNGPAAWKSYAWTDHVEAEYARHDAADDETDSAAPVAFAIFAETDGLRDQIGLVTVNDPRYDPGAMDVAAARAEAEQIALNTYESLADDPTRATPDDVAVYAVVSP